MAKQRIQRANSLVWSSGNDLNQRKIIAELGNFLVVVPRYGIRPLRHDAREYHDPILAKLIDEGKLSREDIKDGRRHLERLMVNFIRHVFITASNRRLVQLVFEDNIERIVSLRYRELLDYAIEFAGFQLGYKIINDGVLDAIKQQYPVLAEECEAQRSGDPFIEPEDIFRIYSPSGGW